MRQPSPVIFVSVIFACLLGHLAKSAHFQIFYLYRLIGGSGGGFGIHHEVQQRLRKKLENEAVEVKEVTSKQILF